MTEYGSPNQPYNVKLSLRLRIAAIYLIVDGTLNLFWPFIVPEHPEFASRSVGYHIGAYLRIAVLESSFIVSGISILLKKPWGRRLGLVIIPINTIYTTASIAWAIALGTGGGNPSFAIYCIATGIAVMWYAVPFYFLLNKRKKDKSEAMCGLG